MKPYLVVTMAIALLVTAGVATAELVTVDFSVLGSDAFDITVPNSYYLNGITFDYDNFGSELDFATIDALGIFGSTYGGLLFSFDTPATGIDFNFSLLGAPELLPEGLVVLLNNAGEDVAALDTPTSVFNLYDPNDPSQGGDALGAFSYNGAQFDQAYLFFSTDAPFFTVDSISYTPIPEPSSIAFLGTGLLGLGSRLIRRRH